MTNSVTMIRSLSVHNQNGLYSMQRPAHKCKGATEYSQLKLQGSFKRERERNSLVSQSSSNSAVKVFPRHSDCSDSLIAPYSSLCSLRWTARHKCSAAKLFLDLEQPQIIGLGWVRLDYLVAP